jgi:hypothetical protein
MRDVIPNPPAEGGREGDLTSPGHRQCSCVDCPFAQSHARFRRLATSQRPDNHRLTVFFPFISFILSITISNHQPAPRIVMVEVVHSGGVPMTELENKINNILEEHQHESGLHMIGGRRRLIDRLVQFFEEGRQTEAQSATQASSREN